ncbi:AraC family transcriptional regulator [Helicovermis profundi]|uniref:HTH araC/xylS-type domain-containing protein n=1 Tax=Helicovermis profundi TaxID=3065157 RepID=A0AAU9EAR3_9FIRM|nr:hypothetical protein HLPR_07000 [Clostridia bacterium S502]
MRKDLLDEKLKNINFDYIHPSYNLEKKLVNEIKLGLLNEAKNTLDMINSIERAIIAKNTLRSAKNSIIISCALFTRGVIQAGIEPEEAFNFSDIFIRKIESFNVRYDLLKFEYTMIDEFIELINNKNISKYSRDISKLIKYINSNITRQIKLEELSFLSSKSPEYLSKLFKNEVGINIVDYINHQKIESSKMFLEFTNMRITDISAIFDFCNPGYFSLVFKKIIGISPKEYRKSI